MGMTSTTLKARYMSWVDEAQPSRNLFNKTGYLALQGTAGKRKKAVLWFASPFDARGGNVLQAKLRLRTRALSTTGTHTVTAGLAGTWGCRFGSLTWNNAPVVSGAKASVSKSGALGLNTVLELDVTSQMQRVADGAGFYGFVVESPEIGLLNLQGNMGSALVPELVVSWSLAPKPPAALEPSGGRSVGTPTPVLRWDFFDHAGNELLQSVQVQLSLTSSFSSVLWDSGEKNTSWCTLDLAAAGFTGAGTGVLVWWRARNRDQAGLWSGWSQPASWRYDPLPTVALVNPPAGVIGDPSPRVDWTFTGTGSPQEQYRVTIDQVGGQTKNALHYDSRWRAGAETSFTPPVTMSFGQTYEVALFVRDSRDRQATPGFNSNVVIRRQVTPDSDAATVGVKNMTVSNARPLPTVWINWQRDEQPDQWVIYRDDVLLARYPGDALWRSGTTYGITDALCPLGEHTWKVFAITNGKASRSGAITGRSEPTGTWLCNEETGEMVCFLNDVEHDITMPEDVTIHTPLGARHGVAITQSQRGYEGTIEGLLVDFPGLPADQSAKLWRERLLRFKTDVGQVYRLLIEDQSFEVQITEVDVTGHPGFGGGVMWNASLRYRQVDDYNFG